MTVVKDDEVATSSGEVSEAPEEAKVEDTDELDFITDSKLPDDWSVIGSKALDNEGSDGESVEVIPCEEEKSEAGSCSADGTSNKLAVETRENVMQTEEIVLFRNLSLWHPGVIALSIICHLLICLVFYSANEGGDIPDLRSEYPRSEYPRSKYPRSEYLRGEYPKSESPRSEVPRSEVPRSEVPRSEPPPSGPRLSLPEFFLDWEEKSTRNGFEKKFVTNFFKHYFRSASFDEEIRALLDKDLELDGETINVVHRKRHEYTPNPPPTVHKAKRSTIPPAQPHPQDPPKKSFDKSSDPPNKNSENAKFDCSNCKKYSSECKKFCKHNKGNKNLKYYYDKIVAPIVKKFKNNF